MPVVTITTYINAPIAVVFDLSRSIDLHLVSAAQTKEKAVAGRISGLISEGESVTWQAKHFGVTQYLSVIITEYKKPYYFTDEMTKGAFKSMKHQHIFKEVNGKVQMTDVFTYTSPLDILGKLADVLFLKKYMCNFLSNRNKIIKEVAEDENKYKKILLQ